MTRSMRRKLPTLPAQVIFWVFLCLSSLTAQSIKVTEVAHKWMGYEMPGLVVTSLVETSDGYLWLGCHDAGLLRDEGKNVKVFSVEAGINGSVRLLAEDKRGHLWVGTRPSGGFWGGVYVSELPVVGGILSKDLHFRSTLNGDTLATGSVNGLVVDTLGQIWTLADSTVRIYRWVGDTSLQVIILRPDGPGSQNVVSIAAANNGSVWITFAGGWLYNYELSTAAASPQLLTSFQVTAFEGGADINGVKVTTVDDGGVIWGTNASMSKYLRIDPGDRTLIVGDPDVTVESVQPFDDESMIVLTQGKGFLFVDRDNAAASRTFGPDVGFPTNTLFATLVSQQGDLWFGGLTGAFHLPTDFRAFLSYTNEAYDGRPALLSEPAINNVNVDFWKLDLNGARDTFTLAGTMNGLLIIPKVGAPYTFTAQDGLPMDIVLGAVQDRDGGIYLTSFRKGIFYIHPRDAPHPQAVETADLTNFAAGYQIDLLSTARLFMPFMFQLPGATEQTFWGAQSSQVVCRPKGDLPMVFSAEAGYDSDHPATLHLDERGFLHLVNAEGWYRSLVPITAEHYARLAVADNLLEGKGYLVKTPSFERVTFEPDGVDRNNITASLLVGDDLWVAVDTQLLIVDPATARVKRTFSFLGFDHFATGLTRHDDLVWAGTSGGLYGIAISDLSIRHLILAHDGLLSSNNYSPLGLQVDQGGRIYQATAVGLQTVDPALDLVDTFTRPAFVTDLSYTEDGQGRNELSVSYTLLSYRDRADNIRYQTKLTGYDDEWSDITFETELRYTNLTAYLFPKTYYMEVNGMDYRGDNWVSAPEAYPVVVNPPLSLRWWAVLGYMLLFMLAIRTYTRFRLGQQKKDLRLREGETIRRQRDEIASKNTENETLLKEIHHRVKNNLEVVSSLLELQSATLADGTARDAMLASQSRVASMGLLHQKLYRGQNLATVNMGEYLSELTETIFETYGVENGITMSVHIPPALMLDVDSAVPLGLIVNELVTNSIKYAFAIDQEGAGAGAIEVTMSSADGEHYLCVSDNGGGKGSGTTSGTGFGTRLVNLLTHQLDGRLVEAEDAGLRTEIRWSTAS